MNSKAQIPLEMGFAIDLHDSIGNDKLCIIVIIIRGNVVLINYKCLGVSLSCSRKTARMLSVLVPYTFKFESLARAALI